MVGRSCRSGRHHAVLAICFAAFFVACSDFNSLPDDGVTLIGSRADHDAATPSSPPGAAPDAISPAEQLATFLFLLREGPDRDNDGIPDVIDETDGPDTDGDGIPNAIDSDADGDGIPNRFDPDIDGDGIFNEFDFDIDGDNLIGDADPDEDGDGLSDRFDLDLDGSGAPDNKKKDDEPDDRLLDLVARMRDGTITEDDRNAIAREISERLDNSEQRAELQALLGNIITQAVNPARQVPPTTVPVGISAIDAVYEQLAETIEQVRNELPNPNGPLPPAKLKVALTDFRARTNAITDIADAARTLSVNELADNVSRLREDLSPAQLAEFAREIGDFLDPDALDDPAATRAELADWLMGAAKLGGAFPDDSMADVLTAVDRLRRRAADAATEMEQQARFSELLDRVAERATADDPDDMDTDVTSATDDVEAADDATDDDQPTDDDNAPPTNGNSNAAADS